MFLPRHSVVNDAAAGGVERADNAQGNAAHLELIVQVPCFGDPSYLRCLYSAGQSHGRNLQSLSLEGVSQMVYILPERLPALVRPAFDLVLRRIRSLKRCVEA